MTDTQNTQPVTNQPAPAAPVQTPTHAVQQPAVQTAEEKKREAEERRKQLEETVQKVVDNYNGFKNFLDGFSTKTLCALAAGIAIVLYAGSDCRGTKSPREIYSNGSRQPAGIEIRTNGVKSIFYCETPELLNEIKTLSQRKGIALENLLQQIDTERPYGKITEKEVEKYLSK